jgi:hypothetical protein
MPRRRKKRSKIVWSRLLGLFLALNVGAGLAFSPITSAHRVRVQGARAYDEQHINAALQNLKDIPCLRVNGYRLESRILQSAEVRSARLSRNIFGRALLNINYYQPVACVSGTNRIALSQEGVLHRTLVSLDDLPKIVLPKPAYFPGFALCSGWECSQLASIANRLKDYDALRKTILKVDSRGSVCLNSEGGARITLGPTERLDEKFDKLDQLLREQPDLLLRARELNLVSPSRAAVILRTGGVQP